MKSIHTIFLSMLALAATLRAEAPISFQEIRLIPAGFQKAIFEGDDWKIIHNYPHKISELHFYNGTERIPSGRDSLTSSRVSHVLYDVMSDGDLSTATDWSKLTFPAAMHGAFKDYGHRMKYIFAQQATHAIIATPDAETLRNLSLSLFQNEDEYIEYDLTKLPEAGNSTVYKLDLRTREIELLDALPEDIKPYASLDPKACLKGEMITFADKDALKKVQATADNPDSQWTCREGKAQLDFTTGAEKTKKLEGSMSLPWKLQPGQTLMVDIDGGYDIWYSKTAWTVQLGNSTFTIKEHKDLFIPDGRQFIAASSRGVGAIEYQLILKRGRGKKQNNIIWAITGNGYNRSGIASLQDADAKQQKLPIKISVVRPWGWLWFNLPDEKWEEGPYINEISIKSVGIGTFTKQLSQLKEAKLFPKPDTSTNNHKEVNKKLAAMKLPKLSPYPIQNKKAEKGRLTDEEIKTIKPWLEALPLPKSNFGLRLEWGEHGISETIYHLLNASDDLDLLEILLLRAEASLNWRNGSDKYQISFISDRIPEGRVLPGTWPSGEGSIYLNGTSHHTGDTWDYSSWLMSMLVTDYVAKHPELYNQKVKAGKDAGRMTWLQKTQELLKEASISIDSLILVYSDPETMRFTRPWNRFSTNILAFHYMHSTFTHLKKQGIAVNEDLAKKAEKATHTFLADFFAPSHYEVYQAEVDGKMRDFIAFRYAPSPNAPAEDKQHASAEIHVLKQLYFSGMYPELFKDRYVDLLHDTIKYRLYKGKKGNEEVFAATFAKEPAMEHAGTRKGIPYSCLWAFCRDPEYYDRFEKMYHKAEAQTWNDYAKALLMRIERQNYLQP